MSEETVLISKDGMNIEPTDNFTLFHFSKESLQSLCGDIYLAEHGNCEIRQGIIYCKEEEVGRINSVSSPPQGDE